MKINEIIVDRSKVEFESLIDNSNSTVLYFYNKLYNDSNGFKLLITDILNPEDIHDIIEEIDSLQNLINSQFRSDSQLLKL